MYFFQKYQSSPMHVRKCFSVFPHRMDQGIATIDDHPHQKNREGVCSNLPPLDTEQQINLIRDSNVLLNLN